MSFVGPEDKRGRPGCGSEKRGAGSGNPASGNQSFPLHLVAGWAHEASCMLPLARALESQTVCHCHGVADLEPPAARRNASYGYAQGLAGRLCGARTPAFLGGWSMGGMVALETAIAHPEAVRGLVLISSTARFTLAHDYPHGATLASLRSMTKGLAQDVETTLQGFSRLSARPHRRGLDELAHEAEALVRGLRYLQEADLRPLVASLECPVLILHGAADAVIPVGAARWLSEHLPRARLVEFTGVGHDLPLREPLQVAAEIRKFLA